ncbi:MAG: hypothetical protein ACRECO_12370 [Xanthobacteraceae bacterium]
MFRQAMEARDLAEIERRMRTFEQRLDRLGGVAARESRNAVTSISQGSARVADAVMTAIGDIVDRFRDNARSAGGEAARVGQRAAEFGSHALHRVSSEVEHRPLVTLAIAVGIGILIGAAARR